MENGGHVDQGPSSPKSAVVVDKHVDGAGRALVVGDGSGEEMAGVAANKVLAGGDYDGEVVEDEDVYSMDVSDELAKRNRFAVWGPIAPVTALPNPEFELEVSSETDTVMSTVIIESASEFEAATESGTAEIEAADIAALRVIALSNETPMLKLENPSEVTTGEGVNATLENRDYLRVGRVLELAQEALTGAEVVGRVISGSNTGTNEQPEALKFADDKQSNVTAFRLVKVDEAKSLHDVEGKVVPTVACSSSLMSGYERESSRTIMHGEPEASEYGQPSGRTEESSAIRSRPMMARGMLVDAKKLVSEVSPSEAERTELSRDMELFEASDREEQARLLGTGRGKLEQDEKCKESPNDRKRALDLLSPERQRKLSRKMPLGDEWKKDDEDVCFICFDGGDLVLCDRRSCPKAYHLSCIGRDAAFFKKKGAWLCGWHFCSVCTKPGSFQCYTCPTAYCGICIDKAEFLLLRKRKGLCEDCLPIVSMIERNETINADGVEVDFEDQETYECLFKEYWGDLKRRLLLVVPELDTDGKPVGGNGSLLDHNGSESEGHTENDERDKDTDESDHDNSESLDAAGMQRRALKIRMGSDAIDKDVNPGDENDEGDQEQLQVFRSQTFESWASTELLEFIDHMKEDPTKPLSRFAVNKLLWSYIKRHKLQDSRKSSQINCDDRLKSIFGKESVGQFEMFKHLQVHFPARSFIDSSKSKDVQRGHNAMTEDDAVDIDGSEDKSGAGVQKERRRGRRSADEKFERPNSAEYAAITPKNIDLIYLRRALLRDLLEDLEFDNKVMDTFVRIRVPGISTKTETTYRLVLVTGTRIGEESYKAGTKMTNVVLEILNLQKKEDVTVDLVSNQDFTEEECQRLRQSIKCGFITALTVGQVEEKAISLREAKVNDWFENERQRLINLRDRASEKGRKKELRECVEKLQELGSPAFRAAKLQARPEVTADPHMDPGYESDANDISPLQGGSRKFRPKVSPRGTESGSKNWDGFKLEESVNLGRKGDFDNQRSKSSWEEAGRSRGYGRVGHEGGRSSEKLGLGRESAFGFDGKLPNSAERDRPRVWDKVWERGTRGDEFNWNSNGGRSDVDQWTAEVGDMNYGRGEARAGSTPVFGQARSEWGSTRGDAVPSTIMSSSASLFCATSPSLPNLAALEKEKLWHYHDPTGMAQGPFTMEQLRKWSTTGLFPLNLTIWKTGQVQEKSILLTEALAGGFQEELWAASRSKSRNFLVGESPLSWGGSSWSAVDSEHSGSRTEQIQVAGDTDWDSRVSVDRGRTWARGQSSYSGAPVGTGRMDDWSGSRSRAETDIWVPSRKCADGSNWGGSEGGKNTYSRTSTGRDHDAAAARDGSRSVRGPRGSKKDVPCRFYAKGYCKRGDACEFWHG